MLIIKRKLGFGLGSRPTIHFCFLFFYFLSFFSFLSTFLLFIVTFCVIFHWRRLIAVYFSTRPARTPSERSRARSLDDLSKSCQQVRQPGDSVQHHHHHHHHHPQQLGSDNGLDKIDWETPFDPVVGWHSLAGQSSSSSKKILATRLDYDDQDDESQEEEEEGDEEEGEEEEEEDVQDIKVNFRIPSKIGVYLQQPTTVGGQVEREMEKSI